MVASPHRLNLPDGRTVTVHFAHPDDCPDCQAIADLVEAEREAEAVDYAVTAYVGCPCGQPGCDECDPDGDA